MSNWKFSLFFGLLIIGLSTSCSKDDDDDTGGLCVATWTTNIQDEIDAVVAAATAYGNSGSQEDCEKYKQSLRNYLDEVRKYERCYIEAGQRAEFEQAVKESEQDIEDIEC
jgi:hypothetical protein